MPGTDESFHNLPGHWVLARMGKRVLRPGGRELTARLLEKLDITRQDDVVEFAPGMGATARLTLAKKPKSYTAVERDNDAAKIVSALFDRPQYRCVVGQAENTGLPDACADVVYGEAMLTMHSPQQKAAIAREAFRLLRPGGRYGVHEIALLGNMTDGDTQRELLGALAQSVRVGVRPQTIAQWTETFESAGFRVKAHTLAPMHLLEPRRVIADEGFWRALRFAFNVWRTPEARARVRKMRAVFRRFDKNLSAIVMVVEKPL